ncbi:MAG: hypothetical protein GEV28_17245 [Actinophytocola sp.]|uniref:recombinase family protein n=1 Tax=Actinophytocola sp. TaxID=1872138 RepID=UPI001329D156|nr:recombinase family protein [Actinophytocola sp.]MPZ82036.1 hypothetical protein [Actinophytocola sp.]
MAYVGGPRRFGWPGGDLTWQPAEGQTDEDRPQVPAAQVAREREAIRAAADELLAGVSQGEIVRAWNKEGLWTVTGLPWTAKGLRLMMLRATNAGLIEQDDKFVSRIPGEPIIDPEVFERLRSMYKGRSRGRPIGERYVGTGILRCAVCGHTLSAVAHQPRLDSPTALADLHVCRSVGSA